MTGKYQRCAVCYDLELVDKLNKNGGICGVCEAIRQLQATVKRKHRAYFAEPKSVRQPTNDP